jgi:hypothetical protein
MFDKLAIHQRPTPSFFPNMPEQSRMEQSIPEQSRMEQGRPEQSRMEQGRPEQSRPEQSKMERGKMEQGKMVRGKMVASMLVDGKMERRTERKKRHSGCLLSCHLHKMELRRLVRRSCYPLFCLLSCLHRNEMEPDRQQEQQLRKNRRKMMILLEKRVGQKARQSQYHCF